MAKKGKDLETSEWDLDDGLDMPDFDFDVEMPKDDRKPGTKIATSFAEGAKDTLLSGGFLRDRIKKDLPKGYGKGLSQVDSGLSTLRQLYNEGVKEARPMVGDMKRMTKRLMPTIERYAPKGAAERARKWAESGDKKAGMSPEEIREQGLQAQLGEVFQNQVQNQQEQQNQRDARESIREQIGNIRHRDSMSQLDAIRTATGALQQYQEKVTASYQRKSLELQYRHYFVAMDALEESKKVNATTIEHLATITKNTALPEFVKITQSERVAEILRSKFINGVADTVFDKRRDFMRNFQKNLSQSVRTRVRDFSDNVRNGIGMADSYLDMQEMQAEMGGGPSPGEMAGNMAGSAVADSLGGKLGQWMGKKARKNETVRKWGNKLQYFGENTPQLAWDFAKSDKGNDLPLIGGLVQLLKEAMGNGDASYSMTRDSGQDMQKPAIFSNQTRKTINEVIPGLLALMYQELQIIRTGDTSTGLVRYDFSRNRFAKDQDVRNNAFGSLFKKSDIEYHQKDVESLLNDLDPESDKLTPEARKALGQFLFRDNMANNVGSAKRLSEYDTFTGDAARHGDELSEFFKEYFKNDKEGERALKFTQSYNRLGSGLSDIRELTQMYMNLGQEDILRDIGIINDDGTFDRRKMEAYFSGAETYEAAGGGPGGSSRRKKRGRPLPPPPPFPDLPRPTPPPAPGGGGGSGGATFDTTKLESVIREESAKTPAQTAAEILGRIEGMLQNGITMNVGDGSGGPGGSKGLSQMTLGDAIDGVGRGASWVWNRGNKVAGQVWGGAWNMAGKVKRGIGSLFDTSKAWVKGKIDDLSDVYIEVNGQIVPLLTAFKLRGGKYVDDATGKVITKWSEATGAIRDIETGELYTVEQMKEAFSKTEYGASLFKKVGQLKDWAVDKAKQAYGLVGSFYGTLWNLAKKGYDQLDRPCDVYVKGIQEPVLLALTMKGGGYFSKLNQHVIDRPSKIDGPVVNENGELVVTEEMLKEGLFDQFGVPLRTGWKKVLAYGIAAGRKAINGMKRAGNWLKDKAAGLWNGLTGGIGDVWGKLAGPDGIIVAAGSKIHDVLLDIYNLLDTRMPGTPTGMHSGAGSVASGVGGAAGKAAAGARRAKEGLKQKFKDSKAEERAREAARKVQERVVTWGDRGKKVIGDLSGDGVRDGSLKEQALKAKEAAKEKLEAARAGAAAGGRGAYGVAGGALKELLERQRKRDDAEEEKEESGDTNIDLGGGGGDGGGDEGGKRDKSKRRPGESRAAYKARRRAEKLRAKAVRDRYNRIHRVGRLGRAAQTGRAAAGSLGRGALALGRGALLATGIVGEGALAATGAVASGLVSGTMAVGSAALSGAAWLGSAALGFLSAPVVLGALAVGGLAVGGYYGYKYLTKKRLKPLNTVRYAQYGFLAADEDHLQAVMGLEDKVKKGVKYENDVATLSMADMDVKAMAESFGLNLKDKASVDSWFLWFRDRFKPVFLTSLTAVRRTSKEVSLDDVDSGLSPIQKQTYLNLAKFSEGPYSVTYSPFGSKEVLKAGPKEVQMAVDLAMASVQKELADKPASSAEKLAQAGVLGAGAASALQLKDAENTRLDKDKLESTAEEKRKAAMDRNRLLIGGGVGFSAAAFKGADLPKGRTANGRIDALTCVRYKSYGLKELELPRVRALDALEEAVERTLEISGDGVAVWKGDPHQILGQCGGAFGISGIANTKAYDWLTWFNYRFLPVYLNYATAVYRNTNRNKPSQGVAALKPAAQVDVATVIYTTSSNYDSRLLSVFTVLKSPWADYELNSDVKSVDVNMAALKEAAKNAILGETEGRLDAATLARPENKLLSDVTNQYKKSDQIDFKNNPSMMLSTVDKGRGLQDAANRYGGGLVGAKGTGYSMIPGGAGTYSGGMEIKHPGNGTGGDINSLPQSQARGWAAQGPIIMGAAKMAGFDPNLMASIAAAESGFDPNIGAGDSSAVGLFQFITKDKPGRDSTWTAMKKKYGKKYGISMDTPATDARANALLGAEFMKENAATLAKRLGRPVTDTDIYMAHFLGAGGATKFLKANPNTVAPELFPTEASSNKPVFYHDGKKATRPRTLGEIYQHFTTLIKSRKAEFGVPANLSVGGSETPAAQPPGMPAVTGGTPVTSTGADKPVPAVPSMLAPIGAGAAAAKAPGAMPDASSLLKAPGTGSPAASPPTTGGPTSAPSSIPTEPAPKAPVAALAGTAATVASAPPEEQKVKPPVPRAPTGVPVDQQAEINRSISQLLPPKSTLPPVKETLTPAATSADVQGLGKTLLDGNAIARETVDVLKELVVAVNTFRQQSASKVNGVPEPVRTRQSSSTPQAPISLKKTQ